MSNTVKIVQLMWRTDLHNWEHPAAFAFAEALLGHDSDEQRYAAALQIIGEGKYEAFAVASRASQAAGLLDGGFSGWCDALAEAAARGTVGRVEHSGVLLAGSVLGLFEMRHHEPCTCNDAFTKMLHWVTSDRVNKYDPERTPHAANFSREIKIWLSRLQDQDFAARGQRKSEVAKVLLNMRGGGTLNPLGDFLAREITSSLYFDSMLSERLDWSRERVASIATLG